MEEKKAVSLGIVANVAMNMSATGIDFFKSELTRQPSHTKNVNEEKYGKTKPRISFILNTFNRSSPRSWIAGRLKLRMTGSANRCQHGRRKSEILRY